MNITVIFSSIWILLIFIYFVLLVYVRFYYKGVTNKEGFASNNNNAIHISLKNRLFKIVDYKTKNTLSLNSEDELILKKDDNIGNIWYLDTLNRLINYTYSKYIAVIDNNIGVGNEISDNEWSILEDGFISNKNSNLYISNIDNSIFATKKGLNKWYIEKVPKIVEDNMILYKSTDINSTNKFTIKPFTQYTLSFKLILYNYDNAEIIFNTFYNINIKNNKLNMIIGNDNNNINIVNSKLYVLHSINACFDNNTVSIYVDGKYKDKYNIDTTNFNDNTININSSNSYAVYNVKYANYIYSGAEITQYKAKDLEIPDILKKCNKNITFVKDNMINDEYFRKNITFKNMTYVINKVCPPENMSGPTYILNMLSKNSFLYIPLKFTKSGTYKSSMYLHSPNILYVNISLNVDDNNIIWTKNYTVKSDIWKKITWYFKVAEIYLMKNVTVKWNFTNSAETIKKDVYMYMPSITYIDNIEKDNVNYSNIIKQIKYSNICELKNMTYETTNIITCNSPISLMFDKYYNITEIIILSDNKKNEWLFKFQLSYKNLGEVWVEDSNIYTNNDNNINTIHKMNITTNEIKITPIEWNNKPTYGINIIGENYNNNAIIPYTKITLPIKDMYLNSKKSYRYSEEMKHIEIKLAGYYNIQSIITQGDYEKNYWITNMKILYLVPYTEEYVILYDNIICNSDNNSENKINMNIITNNIRLIPINWHINPSLRIGIEGEKINVTKCEKYNNLSTYSKTESDRQHYSELYNNECRKISYSTHLKEIEKHNATFNDINSKYNELEKSHILSVNEGNSIKQKLIKTQLELDKALYIIQLNKDKKCKPSTTCLPWINTFPENTNLQNISTDLKNSKNKLADIKEKYIKNDTKHSNIEQFTDDIIGNNIIGNNIIGDIVVDNNMIPIYNIDLTAKKNIKHISKDDIDKYCEHKYINTINEKSSNNECKKHFLIK